MSYVLTPDAREQAAKLGLSESVVCHHVENSVPLSNQTGNRRYYAFAFKVTGNTIEFVGTVAADAHPKKARQRQAKPTSEAVVLERFSPASRYF